MTRARRSDGGGEGSSGTPSGAAAVGGGDGPVGGSAAGGRVARAAARARPRGPVLVLVLVRVERRPERVLGCRWRWTRLGVSARALRRAWTTEVLEEKAGRGGVRVARMARVLRRTQTAPMRVRVLLVTARRRRGRRLAVVLAIWGRTARRVAALRVPVRAAGRRRAAAVSRVTGRPASDEPRDGGGGGMSEGPSGTGGAAGPSGA